MFSQTSHSLIVHACTALTFLNDLPGLSKLYVQGGQSITVQIGVYGGMQPPGDLALSASVDMPAHFAGFSISVLTATIDRSNRQIVIATVDTGTEERKDVTVTFTLEDDESNSQTFQWTLQVFRTCCFRCSCMPPCAQTDLTAAPIKYHPSSFSQQWLRVSTRDFSFFTYRVSGGRVDAELLTPSVASSAQASVPDGKCKVTAPRS